MILLGISSIICKLLTAGKAFGRFEFGLFYDEKSFDGHNMLRNSSDNVAATFSCQRNIVRRQFHLDFLLNFINFLLSQKSTLGLCDLLYLMFLILCAKLACFFKYFLSRNQLQ